MASNYRILNIFLLAVGWAIFFPQSLRGQCQTPPDAGSCTDCGTFISNNINNNQTYCYGGSGTASNINLSGGTLRICGKLSISNLNFSSGNLIIEAGGSLTLTGGNLNLNGNCLISNRGSLIISRTITMQNSNNFLFNVGTDANLSIGDTDDNTTKELVLNSSTSYFVNQGTADIEKLRVQAQAPANAVCLGAGATLNLINLQVDAAGQFAAPEGPAIISISGTAQLNSPLTSDANLYICEESGANLTGAGSFGAATMSCSIGTFPVEWLAFDGVWDANLGGVQLTWSTATEVNNAGFSIEQSLDGTAWQGTGSLPGAGNSSQPLTYEYFTSAQPGNVYFFRIRQSDFDGSFSYSQVLQINTTDQISCQVFPNPCHDVLHIHQAGIQRLELVTAMGQVIYTVDPSTRQIDLPMHLFPSGIYVLRAAGDQLHGYSERVIKR